MLRQINRHDSAVCQPRCCRERESIPCSWRMRGKTAVTFPGPLWKSRTILLGSAAVFALLRLPAFAQETAPVAEPVVEESPEIVVITARRTELIGVAVTSSEGIILREELLQLPTLRPGQLLETVPGLVVTIHSGEGKANQYLLRGVNLDHGTDLATFVDGMPVNMRTHAHGQGYTDLNFFIPELASGITYTKGPYFARKATSRPWPPCAWPMSTRYRIRPPRRSER